jgi:hypothetical protein
MIPPGRPESEGTAASPPFVDWFANGATRLAGRLGRGECAGTAFQAKLPTSNNANTNELK